MLSFKLVFSAIAFAALASAAPVIHSPLLVRDDTYICGYGEQGIKKPANNTAITAPSGGDPAVFEVIYCSGQYFKTSSLSASVLLSNPANGPNDSGMILVNNVEPDNKDAPAGYYSYRMNVSMYPEDGDFPSGPQTLSIYETETGYYNPNNYDITSITVTFVPANTSYPTN